MMGGGGEREMKTHRRERGEMCGGEEAGDEGESTR